MAKIPIPTPSPGVFARRVSARTVRDAIAGGVVIPITVYNSSGYDCTGGKVTFTLADGTEAPVVIDPIQNANTGFKLAHLDSPPNMIRWHFRSNEGVEWVHPNEDFPEGTPSVHIELNPEGRSHD
jgi:hypothetical protein